MQALVNSIDHIYSEISDMSGEQQKCPIDSEHFSHFPAVCRGCGRGQRFGQRAADSAGKHRKSAEALSEANQELLNAINKFNV
ncbi:hypothetical protein PO124_06735 [Bacillus licheniformis]|nr:hypothetical protein [Bacillus licheniformis]